MTFNLLLALWPAASLLVSTYGRPPLLFSVTSLLAAGIGPVGAAGPDSENEVKSILEHMEKDVLALRDELERVYSSRCETKTLTECHESNFNDCSSAFPNQQCMLPDELVISACRDSEGCNALWDKTVSAVSLPASLAKAPHGNPGDREIIESACYSRLAEPYMADKYEADEEFWAEYDVQPSWTYFGAHDGLFRKIPAAHREQCGRYDPRRRPWFVAASSGPKDVILVIDTSGSMNDYDRMDIAREAARTIVDTLTVADRVAVVSFSGRANQIGGHSSLVRATNENKKQLVEAIRGLEAKGATKFYDAFSVTFDALDKTQRIEATSGCNVAILFMTDGEISEGPGEDAVIGLVNDRVERFAANYDRKATIFAFSLGRAADHEVAKKIACSTNGIWTPVDDLTGDLVTAMASYYKLYALGLGEGGNENFTAWVEPYEFADPAGKTGTTVSAPVYDRSVSPPLFLGVVAVDMYMDALEKVITDRSSMLERFVLLSTARCPKIELTQCELDAFRFLGGQEEATCGVCNGTSEAEYSGIVPEKCPFQSDLPNNLWSNTEMEGYEYEDRACCESGGTVPSDSCPADRGDDGETDDADASGIAGFIFVVCFMLLLCGCVAGCFYLACKNRKSPININYSIPSTSAVAQPAPHAVTATATATAAPTPMYASNYGNQALPPNVVTANALPPGSASMMNYGNQVQPGYNAGAAYNPSAPPINPAYGYRR